MRVFTARLAEEGDVKRIAVGIALAAVLWAGCGGEDETFSLPEGPEPPPTLKEACGTTFGVVARPFWLGTGDGVRLYAAEAGAGMAGVVLAHESGQSLCNWLRYAEALVDRGTRVLAIDFRAYGRSERPEDEEQVLELGNDLAAAAAYLRDRGTEKVFLMGGSLGGAAVVQNGSRLDVDGIVSLSGTRFFAGYGVNDPDAVHEMKAAFLLVSSRDDGNVPVEEARSVFASSGSSDKRLELRDGSTHGLDLLDDPAIRSLVLAWIGQREAD